MKKIILLFVIVFFYAFANAQWNPNTSVNLSVAAVNSSDIVTKETRSGKTFIAFYSQNGRNYDMRAQLLDSAGDRLFGDSGLLVSNLKSGSATYVFNACVDKENNFIIAFQYQKQGNTEIVAYKIDSLGNNLWGKNGISLGQGLAPYATTLTDNDIIIAWNNNENSISYQRINPRGKVVWDTPKIFSGTHSVTRPQVVATTLNGFSFIYQSVAFPPFYTNLYEQKFDRDGNALWTNPVQLSNYVTAGYTYYSVLANVDTTYVGYFANPSGSNRFDGFIQRINPDGSLPFGINGTEFATYAGNSQPYTMGINIAHELFEPYIWAVATMSDFNQNNYGISVQKVSTITGERLFGNHAKTIFPISDTSDQQQGRLTLTNRQPLFIYTDVTNALYATSLDSNGNFIWPNRVLTIGGTLNQKNRFGLTKAINQDAVAVWQEDRGSGDMPFAQNISSTGKTGTLPVTFLNFDGVYNKGISNLTWQTASEINNIGFEVQRSTDGNTFYKIGFVASQATGGNSTKKLSYAYNDVKVVDGNLYYRLKQIDKDGNYTYSNIIVLHVTLNKATTLYPNPVANVLNIYLNSSQNDKATFTVTDMLGKTVMQISQNISAGNNLIKIDCTSLRPGTYFVKASGSTAMNFTFQKFIKQ